MAESVDIKNTRKWLECWSNASIALQEIRAQEIRDADTSVALKSFAGMLPRILESYPPDPWSGLVEQQRIFSRLRHE